MQRGRREQRGSDHSPRRYLHPGHGFSPGEGYSTVSGTESVARCAVPHNLPLDNRCYNTHYPSMSSRLLAELKQTKPFPRPAAEALVSILRTAAVLEHEVNEALKPFELTSTQY